MGRDLIYWLWHEHARDSGVRWSVPTGEFWGVRKKDLPARSNNSDLHIFLADEDFKIPKTKKETLYRPSLLKILLQSLTGEGLGIRGINNHHLSPFPAFLEGAGIIPKNLFGCTRIVSYLTFSSARNRENAVLPPMRKNYRDRRSLL